MVWRFASQCSEKHSRSNIKFQSLMKLSMLCLLCGMCDLLLWSRLWAAGKTSEPLIIFWKHAGSFWLHNQCLFIFSVFLTNVLHTHTVFLFVSFKVFPVVCNSILQSVFTYFIMGRVRSGLSAGGKIRGSIKFATTKIMNVCTKLHSNPKVVEAFCSEPHTVGENTYSTRQLFFP